MFALHTSRRTFAQECPESPETVGALPQFSPRLHLLLACTADTSYFTQVLFRIIGTLHENEWKMTIYIKSIALYSFIETHFFFFFPPNDFPAMFRYFFYGNG